MTDVNVPPVKTVRSFPRTSDWTSLTTSCIEPPSLSSSSHVSQGQFDGSVPFFWLTFLGSQSLLLNTLQLHRRRSSVYMSTCIS